MIGCVVCKEKVASEYNNGMDPNGGRTSPTIVARDRLDRLVQAQHHYLLDTGTNLPKKLVWDELIPYRVPQPTDTDYRKPIMRWGIGIRMPEV